MMHENMTDNQKVGSVGERFTTAYLLKEGYEIIANNYAIAGVGEVDIIARKGNILAFVEVKTRSPRYMVAPAQAVNKAKQRRICKTAILFLQREKYRLQPRFDVAEVILQEGNTAPIVDDFRYYPNAFFAPENLRYF